jgi:hypothetical protein
MLFFSTPSNYVDNKRTSHQTATFFSLSLFVFKILKKSLEPPAAEPGHSRTSWASGRQNTAHTLIWRELHTTRSGPISGKRAHTNHPNPHSKCEPISPKIRPVPSSLWPDSAFYIMQGSIEYIACSPCRNGCDSSAAALA